MTRRLWLACVVLLLAYARVDAANITVCDSGTCTYTNANIQSALNAAQPGDSVLLEAGHTYLAPDNGFVLGARCMSAPHWDCITVRTGVTVTGSIMSTSSFPADGVRMPAGTYRGTLAKLVPTVNNSPSLRTIWPGETGVTCASMPCRGDGWTIKWLEFSPKVDYAQRPLVVLGTNKVGKEWNLAAGCTYPDATPSCWTTTLPNGETQDTLVEVPQYISFIQNDMHGDSFVGQYNGLGCSTKDIRILHNSITDMKAMDESKALICTNAIGPFDVENNLLESTGINSMWGGSDPYYQLRATVSGSPTTTSITLSSPVWVHPELTTSPANLATDMYSEVFVKITHAGKDYAGIKCTLSGSTCTLSPAMPVTPSVGDVVRWEWVHGGVVFKYNWNHKNAAWMGNALSTPTGVTATAGTGGSLSAGTHCYRLIMFAYVAAADPDIFSAPSSEVCATTGSSGKVTISWPANSHATRWWVYGNGAAGAENQSWQVTGASTSYVDTGAAGSANTPPTYGSYWLVKNTLEWKGCDGYAPAGQCIAEGNVIDTNWCCSQNNTVTLKVHDQFDGAEDISQTLRNFIFRNNWVRHGDRAIALVTSSTGNTDTPQASGYMADLTISNNLFTDLSNTWGWPPGSDTGNSAILITSGDYGDLNVWPGWTNKVFVGSRGCHNCSFTHNSFFVNSDYLNGPMWMLLKTGDSNSDLVVRNNIMARDCLVCSGSGNVSLKSYINDINQGQGTAGWTPAVSGSSAADHNAWPDGSSGTYTAGPFTNSFFIADATIKSSHLVNYTNCNNDTDILGCGLQTSSSMHLAGSDGTDIGAIPATIKAFTDIALSGDMSGGGGTPPPPPTTSTGGRAKWKAKSRGN